MLLPAHLTGAVEYTGLQHYRGVRSPNECLAIKQSNVEAPVMLELWGMQSTSSLPMLPGPLWPGVVAPDRVLSMSQIELFDLQTNDMLNWIKNRTVWSFNCVYTNNWCLIELLYLEIFNLFVGLCL